MSFLGVAIVRQDERGVVFRLGKLLGVRDPGLRFVTPFGIDRVHKDSLRTVTMPIPSQQAITRDNVSIGLAAATTPAAAADVFPAQLMDTTKALTAFMQREVNGSRVLPTAG